MAACADSCITSPSLPVSVSRPLPSIKRGFGGQHRAADFRPGQARGEADLVVLFQPELAIFQHAEKIVDVGGRDFGFDVALWPSVTTLRAILRQMF